MASVEIIGAAPSSYTRVVRMACEEKGIAYTLTPAMPHAPEVAAIHPFGKIPAMRHGDFTLCESKAIATYIDRAFEGPPLFPSEPRELATAEKWISLVNTEMDRTFVRTYIFAHFFPETADRAPDRQKIAAVLPQLRAQLQLLDEGVAATGFLAGKHYGFADINVMPILYYLRMLPEAAAAIGEGTHLSAYYERNAARPAFKNTIPPPPQA
jgi:glutathione S-transferase